MTNYSQIQILKARVEPVSHPSWNMFTAAKNRMASSLQSHPGLLDKLARRVNTLVQVRVAENGSTDAETLTRLSHHESSEVRAAVGQNANTAKAVSNSLSADGHCDVRYAMAENPKTSVTNLNALSEDENPYVQDRARRTQANLKAEATIVSDV